MAKGRELHGKSTRDWAEMPSSSEDHGAEHFDFDKEKGPTINVIEGISTGGEAVIDEVEVQDTYQRAPFVCVRRSYIFHPSRRTFQSLKNAHLKEVAILKKLINQRHFIELLGSYTKDAEKPNNLALVILQNPRADCDLASLLDKTPENRQAIISDGNLERGIACLASALYFLHSIRIRHKDIASKNILVHGNQLLFADFGLSMDFSELSNSETCSFVNQQPKYRPPEGYHGRKHTCASDVFSLGCVFFEILTTLSHANTESYEEGKSDGGAISEEKAKVEGGDEFQDVWPYRDHLKEIYRRLEKKRKTAERQASTQRLFWLKKTEQMLAKPLGDRIKMFEILLELWQEFEGDPEGFAATACESCQNHIKTLDIRLITEPMNVDFEAEPNKAVPVSENPATGSISSESQQNFYHHIGAWMYGRAASIAISVGLVTRWNLEFYLDNGRKLRMYGIRQTGNVDLKFDFGDMLVERVKFKAGTFGKIVTLYGDKTEPEKHRFRSTSCIEVFSDGITVWRYKISGDE